jgi:hypothetical protein
MNANDYSRGRKLPIADRTFEKRLRFPAVSRSGAAKCFGAFESSGFAHEPTADVAITKRRFRSLRFSCA